MNFPAELKYTKDHEWIRVDGDVAYVGITDYAQSELGEIVFVDAVKTVSDLFMPVGGEVLEVNPELEDQPELVNSDVYGKGWIIKVSISNPTELDELMAADEYEKMIAK